MIFTSFSPLQQNLISPREKEKKIESPVYSFLQHYLQTLGKTVLLRKFKVAPGEQPGSTGMTPGSRQLLYFLHQQQQFSNLIITRWGEQKGNKAASCQKSQAQAIQVLRKKAVSCHRSKACFLDVFQQTESVYQSCCLCLFSIMNVTIKM